MRLKEEGRTTLKGARRPAHLERTSGETGSLIPYRPHSGFKQAFIFALSYIFLTVLPPLAGAMDPVVGKVVKIADGDTITVLEGRTQHKVRLYGIDCPERGQAFGKKAKQFTSSMAAGKTVTLIVRDKDRYGRLVADVVLPDGQVLNYEIVRAGFAWWYQKYAPGNKSLEALEAEAREKRRGLWYDKEPVPPWEWRRR